MTIAGENRQYSLGHCSAGSGSSPKDQQVPSPGDENRQWRLQLGPRRMYCWRGWNCCWNAQGQGHKAPKPSWRHAENEEEMGVCMHSFNPDSYWSFWLETKPEERNPIWNLQKVGGNWPRNHLLHLSGEKKKRPVLIKKRKKKEKGRESTVSSGL